MPDRVDTDFAVANAAVHVMLRENWLGAAEGNGTCINETEYRPHGQLGGWHISNRIQVRSEALQRRAKGI